MTSAGSTATPDISCPAKVAVIVPAYNAEKTLESALDSALQQSCTALEIIVVNDGSTDGTPAICRSYGNRITVIDTPNRGVAAARNTAIRHARAPFLAFLDSDDIWAPDKLEKQLAVFARFPEVLLVASAMRRMDESGKLLDQRYRATYPNCSRSYRYDLLFNGPQAGLGFSTVMVRATDFRALPGFREDPGMLSTDYEWLIRLSERGRFYVLDDVLVNYRIREDSMQHSSIQREYQAQIDILNIHRAKYAWFFYRKRLSRIHLEWADTLFYRNRDGGWRHFYLSLIYNPLNICSWWVACGKLLRSLRLPRRVMN